MGGQERLFGAQVGVDFAPQTDLEGGEQWLLVEHLGTVPGEASRPVHTIDQVRDYLESPGSIVWLKLGNLSDTESDACVDSRIESAIVGNPAGDIGRMAEAVHAVGAEKEAKLSPRDFTSLIAYSVENNGTFYMHTDEGAVNKLAEAMKQDQLIMKMFPGLENFLGSPESAYELVMNPSFYQGEGDLRVTLLTYLLDPNFMGCGHLKKMFENAKEYGVSEKALRSLTRSFYQLLWDGPKEIRDKLLFPMLMGGHEEGAVLRVEVDMEAQEMTDETMIPAVVPSGDVVHMFVEHHQVQKFLARKLVWQLLSDVPIPLFADLDGQKVLARIDRLYKQGLDTTVIKLGPGLPIYGARLRQPRH